MATRNPSKLTLSIVLGLLAIPVAAVASVAVLGDAPATPAAASEGGPAAPEMQQVVFGAVGPATADDLDEACGEAGMLLVAAEADGTITEIQQAALDALRPICEQQGMPLPGKPEPEPVFETVVVRSGNATASAPTTAAVTSTDDEYEEHEEEYEEHEEEYEEHEEEYEDHEYEEHDEYEHGDD